MVLRRGWPYVARSTFVMMGQIGEAVQTCGLLPIAIQPVAVVSVALCAACLAVMAFIVLVDCTVRLIPRRLCWLLFGTGAACQLTVHGLNGVVAGIIWGFIIFASAWAAALLAKAISGRESEQIGGGDMRCMVALSVATGTGAPIGLAACFVSAALWSVIARVRKRLLPGEPFAFAPFLAVWLVVGILAAT